MKKKISGLKKYGLLIISFLLLAVGVLWMFYNRAEETKMKKDTPKEASELTILINKDLNTNYPDTPRAVVDMYSRIITQYYEGVTEEELTNLIDKACLLMDEELLSHNPYEEYTENVKKDIDAYRKEEQRITYYTLENSFDVEYKTFQGKEYARLGASYIVRNKAGGEKTTQYYTLRKDDTGRWKLLYWELGEN